MKVDNVSLSHNSQRLLKWRNAKTLPFHHVCLCHFSNSTSVVVVGFGRVSSYLSAVLSFSFNFTPTSLRMLKLSWRSPPSQPATLNLSPMSTEKLWHGLKRSRWLSEDESEWGAGEQCRDWMRWRLKTNFCMKSIWLNKFNSTPSFGREGDVMWCARGWRCHEYIKKDEGVNGEKIVLSTKKLQELRKDENSWEGLVLFPWLNSIFLWVSQSLSQPFTVLFYENKNESNFLLLESFSKMEKDSNDEWWK